MAWHPPPVHSARTLRPHPPPRVSPARDAARSEGVRQLQRVDTERLPLLQDLQWQLADNVVMCNKQWIPVDGDYFCGPACIHDPGVAVMRLPKKGPLRWRPTSAEVEPAVAVPIAPALQLQPGAPSNGNLNPVIRVDRRLVLELCKSGSGVWAPFPLSLDQNLEVLTPQNIQKKKREKKKKKKKRRRERR